MEIVISSNDLYTMIGLRDALDERAEKVFYLRLGGQVLLLLQGEEDTLQRVYDLAEEFSVHEGVDILVEYRSDNDGLVQGTFIEHGWTEGPYRTRLSKEFKIAHQEDDLIAFEKHGIVGLSAIETAEKFRNKMQSSNS